MIAIVKYIAFHPDNYQGGSGKSFEFTDLVVVEDEVSVGLLEAAIEVNLMEKAIKKTPWTTDFHISIQSIELFFYKAKKP